MGALVALSAASWPSIAQNNGQVASAPEAALVGEGAARIARGRALFAGNRCGECHTLGDAGTIGHTGPALDGDADLTEQLVVDRVTNGSGPMPDFDDKLSEGDIHALASYLVHVARK